MAGRPVPIDSRAPSVLRCASSHPGGGLIMSRRRVASSLRLSLVSPAAFLVLAAALTLALAAAGGSPAAGESAGPYFASAFPDAAAARNAAPASPTASSPRLLGPLRLAEASALPPFAALV